MDVGECNGRGFYTALRLDYRLSLWTIIHPHHVLSRR